jgi:hypothetical protein
MRCRGPMFLGLMKDLEHGNFIVALLRLAEDCR